MEFQTLQDAAYFILRETEGFVRMFIMMEKEFRPLDWA